MSVLASLSFVYITAHHVVDAIEYICYIYVTLLPSLITVDVQWDRHVQCGKCICSDTDANNV